MAACFHKSGGKFLLLNIVYIPDLQVSFAFQKKCNGTPTFFPYKQELNLLPVGGATLSLGGHISIPRGRKDKIPEIMRQSKERL